MSWLEKELKKKERAVEDASSAAAARLEEEQKPVRDNMAAVSAELGPLFTRFLSDVGNKFFGKTLFSKKPRFEIRHSSRVVVGRYTGGTIYPGDDHLVGYLSAEWVLQNRMQDVFLTIYIQCPLTNRDRPEGWDSKPDWAAMLEWTVGVIKGNEELALYDTKSMFSSGVTKKTLTTDQVLFSRFFGIHGTQPVWTRWKNSLDYWNETKTRGGDRPSRSIFLRSFSDEWLQRAIAELL